MPLKPMNSPTHLDNKHSHTLRATIRAILLLLRAILTMAILKVVHRGYSHQYPSGAVQGYEDDEVCVCACFCAVTVNVLFQEIYDDGEMNEGTLWSCIVFTQTHFFLNRRGRGHV